MTNFKDAISPSILDVLGTLERMADDLPNADDTVDFQGIYNFALKYLSNVI